MSPSLRRIGAACATVGALALAAIGCGGTSAAIARALDVSEAQVTAAMQATQRSGTPPQDGASQGQVS
jgi:hypothetical protein